MLALAAIWRTLQEPKGQTSWLGLASLAYGLAIGSRPSLLFGAIILLVPVAQAWPVATEPGSYRRAGLLLAAAIIPLTVIGLGLMLYNNLRFDNPFEFGWHYQLATAYLSNTAKQFSPHYSWMNFRFYFLEPMRWSGHFPFFEGHLAVASAIGLLWCGRTLQWDISQLSIGMAGSGLAVSVAREASERRFRLTLVCHGCIFAFCGLCLDHLSLFFSQRPL